MANEVCIVVLSNGVDRSFFGVSDREMIKGLPTIQFEDVAVPQDSWERKAEPTTFGKYFRTYTVSRRGNGVTFAKFATVSLALGSWCLGYFYLKGIFLACDCKKGLLAYKRSTLSEVSRNLISTLMKTSKSSPTIPKVCFLVGT